jgi:aromatic-L-amino-acid decarboxylase
MDAVNANGTVFLSHTRLRGRFAIRVAIGHIRADDEHVRRAWELLRREASRLAAGGVAGQEGAPRTASSP